MARIRSLHPGFFTDEATVSVSFAARVLLTGIWTESDDRGVFEWKPVTLKMRLLPADNVDVSALMEELVGSGAIVKFSSDGKDYGAVRNFCKYQRPKKPGYKHPLPDELRTYVAFKDDSFEPIPHQLPTASENSPQMEEEGGRRKEGIAPSCEGARARARAGAIDPIWVPSDGLLAALEQAGFHSTQISTELPVFRAHYRANGEVRDDWGASFEKWMLKARQRGDLAPPPTGSTTGAIWQAKAGDPEWDAWKTHYTDTSAKFSISLMNQAANNAVPHTFPARWPPGHPNTQQGEGNMGRPVSEKPETVSGVPKAPGLAQVDASRVIAAASRAPADDGLDIPTYLKRKKAG